MAVFPKERQRGRRKESLGTWTLGDKRRIPFLHHILLVEEIKFGKAFADKTNTGSFGF